MKKNLKLGILFPLFALFTGCGYVASPYGISAENVNTLHSVGKVKVKLNQFQAESPGESSMTCRAVGSVETPNEESFEKYIEDAFKSELTISGLYDQNASIAITGNLKEIDFDSNIGNGAWEFDMVFTSSNGKSIEVHSKYSFSTNFVAEKACQQVAQALVPSVQKLIHDTITNPGFAGLLQ